MAKKQTFDTVEAYLGSFPNHVQKILRQVQATIQKAVPGAEEQISYQMPAFKYHGWIFYYSAYTHHYSLSCPPPFTVFDAFKKELAPYTVSKSAVQFPYDRPVPAKLISAMAAYRAKANAEKASKTKKG